MNHIKKLQHNVGILGEAIEAFDHEMDMLMVYLTSPKFHSDPTVQVQDVMSRLDEARMLVNGVLVKMED